eukprot:2838453-Amphidinium_carterae.2
MASDTVGLGERRFLKLEFVLPVLIENQDGYPKGLKGRMLLASSALSPGHVGVSKWQATLGEKLDASLRHEEHLGRHCLKHHHSISTQVRSLAPYLLPQGICTVRNSQQTL